MAAGGRRGRRGTTTATKRKIKKPTSQPHRREHLSQILTALSSATSATQLFLSQNDIFLLPSQTLTLETLLSSTSLSISKLLPTTKPLSSPSSSPLPPPCWFQRFITAASSDHDPRWVDAFRMSKPSFTLLLRYLTPSLQTTLPSTPPNYTLAAALYRLAHGASYKSVARRFGLDSAGACRSFYAFCKVVNEKLGHLFEFRSDVGRIAEDFQWISLPNCCGVLGVKRFPIDGGELLGKDGALMVQALVDSGGRFLDVSAGWPSTLKPVTILRQTKLFSGVEESNELLKGPVYHLSDGNSVPQYILGDSCFPLLPWLLTPFIRSNEKEEEEVSLKEEAFNSAHSRAMGLVDTAFERVQARWTLLSRRWKEECIEFLPFVIIAGCLLHNFLIKCSEPLPQLPDKVAVIPSNEEPDVAVYDGVANEGGQRIREALALHLSRVSVV